MNTLAEYIKFNGTTESQYLDNQNILGPLNTYDYQNRLDKVNINTIRTDWK